MAKQKVRVSFDKNEIDTEGKIIAGILLVGFTVLPIVFMIGLWPDQIPVGGNKSPVYKGDLFNITLIPDVSKYKGATIHLNTIMFLLVALAGFMGSMIHLATSFTNYVGSGKFKRSWILWYCVKPFTAAGIAMIFYLVLKAGLLNFDGGAGVNPYAIVILSALAGLFTDKASMKLEEIFTVIFKPKDDRPDKLDEISIKIKGFDPKKLSLDQDNNITITGEGLDKHPLSIKINDQDISGVDIKPDAMSFKFKVPETFRNENKLRLSVLDETGNPVYNGEFEIVNNSAGAGTESAEDDEEDNEEEKEETVEASSDVNAFVKG